MEITGRARYTRVNFILEDILHPPIVKIYFYAKTIASIGSAGVVVYGLIRWFSNVFKKVSYTNDSVQLLMTNHLPHIQQSLNAQDETLKNITSDVRDMDTKVTGFGTRLDDTKVSVDNLNVALINHIENSKEKKRKK